MKLKICHISEATSGGVLTHLHDLAENLDPNLFQQTFVLSCLKNKSLKAQSEFHHHELHIIDMVRNIHPIEDLISLWKLFRLLRKNKFDIIHCHSSKAGVVGRLAALFTGHKLVIYTPHAFSFNSFNSKLKNTFFIFVEKIMAGITSKIICVSDGERQLALNVAVTVPDKLIVIRNGVKPSDPAAKETKTAWLEKMGLNDSEKLIGFVGRLSRQKNPLMLLRSLDANLLTRCAVIIMGDGDLREDVNGSLSGMNGREKVILMGEVNNADEIISYCDVVVCTSYWEGMPYSILEAMAAKVLVIATDIYGVNDVVLNGETGILVPVDDQEQLREQLLEFIYPSDRKQKMIDNAHALINSQYSISQMIARLQSFYISLGRRGSEG